MPDQVRHDEVGAVAILPGRKSKPLFTRMEIRDTLYFSAEPKWPVREKCIPSPFYRPAPARREPRGRPAPTPPRAGADPHASRHAPRTRSALSRCGLATPADGRPSRVASSAPTYSLSPVGRGQGEGVRRRRTGSGSWAPHPNPLPTGERGRAA